MAAVLADAFIDDPVFAFLRPGRLRHEARLRASARSQRNGGAHSERIARLAKRSYLARNADA